MQRTPYQQQKVDRAATRGEERAAREAARKANPWLPYSTGALTPAGLCHLARSRHRSANTHPGKRGRS